MNKIKIFNDPVYGFIRFPYEIIYELINHAYFQRLRRITQLGLSHYVYPGALHSRFHHALGATHLMTRAVVTLREKGVEITDAEAEAVCIAILLHDIGHGPFSHSLEKLILPYSHEEISLAFIQELDRQFSGKLDLALNIFQNKYPKLFLHQLVSSQLDMDRMDYLNRDSFYTGVAEGIIGYDRIIKMFNVYDDQLVIEEKGLYSIEKFLMARRIMYWQVYLHKTVIAVEQMLILFFNRLKQNWQQLDIGHITPSMKYFLENGHYSGQLTPEILTEYAKLDDYDIFLSLKCMTRSEEYVLQFLSNSLLNRILFKIQMQKIPYSEDQIADKAVAICRKYEIDETTARSMILVGSETNQAYIRDKDEILILLKNGEVRKFSEMTEFQVQDAEVEKYFLVAPGLY